MIWPMLPNRYGVFWIISLFLLRYLSNYNKFIAMNKNNYRLNLNDKNGIKAGIISLILGALVFYVFVWKIKDQIPSFQICGDWCPGQKETLLNHPMHLF